MGGLHPHHLTHPDHPESPAHPALSTRWHKLLLGDSPRLLGFLRCHQELHPCVLVSLPLPSDSVHRTTPPSQVPSLSRGGVNYGQIRFALSLVLCLA